MKACQYDNNFNETFEHTFHYKHVKWLLYMYPINSALILILFLLFSHCHIWIKSISMPYEQYCNEQLAVMSINTVLFFFLIFHILIMPKLVELLVPHLSVPQFLGVGTGTRVLF